MSLRRLTYWGAVVVMVAVALGLRYARRNDIDLPVWVLPAVGVLAVAAILWDVRRARRARDIGRRATDG